MSKRSKFQDSKEHAWEKAIDLLDSYKPNKRNRNLDSYVLQGLKASTRISRQRWAKVVREMCKLSRWEYQLARDIAQLLKEVCHSHTQLCLNEPKRNDSKPWDDKESLKAMAIIDKVLTETSCQQAELGTEEPIAETTVTEPAAEPVVVEPAIKPVVTEPVLNSQPTDDDILGLLKTDSDVASPAEPEPNPTSKDLTYMLYALMGIVSAQRVKIEQQNDLVNLILRHMGVGDENIAEVYNKIYQRSPLTENQEKFDLYREAIYKYLNSSVCCSVLKRMQADAEFPYSIDNPLD